MLIPTRTEYTNLDIEQGNWNESTHEAPTNDYESNKTRMVSTLARGHAGENGYVQSRKRDTGDAHEERGHC